MTPLDEESAEVRGTGAFADYAFKIPTSVLKGRQVKFTTLDKDTQKRLLDGPVLLIARLTAGGRKKPLYGSPVFEDRPFEVKVSNYNVKKYYTLPHDPREWDDIIKNLCARASAITDGAPPLEYLLADLYGCNMEVSPFEGEQVHRPPAPSGGSSPAPSDGSGMV